MRSWLLGVVVFVASASVLVLEIIAGRILAPYVGVSLQTFTGIIGTILAAIALGAWAGGRLADQSDPADLLGPALVVGGITAVLSPALVYLVGPSAAGEDPLTIVFLAAVGFFLPAVILSAVTPIAAKLALTTVDETGTVVGRLSAISTAGALVGTFLTGFVLVAAMPSQPVTWVVGGVLVALGAFLMFDVRRSAALVGVVVLVLSVGITSAIASPCDEETAYSCAIISDREDGGTALILDTFVNSVVDVDDPTFLVLRYARVIDAVIAAHIDGAFRAVYVGGGGYTMPRYYEATRGSTAVVMELDSALPGIAEDELGLIPGPWLETVVGDARLSVRDVPEGTVDVVVGDAFSGRSVPWHLTTIEFLGDVISMLDDDGLYVLNVIDHPPLEFVTAQLATMAEVFDHVAVVAPPTYLEGRRGGNFVLAASNAPFAPDRILGAVPSDEVILVDESARAWAAGGLVLTDEFAPTDQLLSRP